MNAERLTKLYEALPETDKAAGKRWYTDAHGDCKKIAKRYKESIQMVAAIVSALSPGVAWEENVWWAEAVLAQTKKQPFPLSKKYQGYGASWRKAALLAAKELLPHEAFDHGKAPKTYNFFLNILDPSDPAPVTIDRHAARIHGADPDKLNLGTYRRIAQDYRDAAKGLGLLPHQLQAALWGAQRENRLPAMD